MGIWTSCLRKALQGNPKGWWKKNKKNTKQKKTKKKTNKQTNKKKQRNKKKLKRKIFLLNKISEKDKV